MNVIEYNYHEYPNEAVYISLSFNVGVATRYFLLRGKEVFANNLAFANVFVNCVKQIAIDAPIDYNVDRTITTIHLKSSHSAMAQDLMWIAENVLNLATEPEQFEKVKAMTVENFRQNYKNGQFRGWHKAYEVADLNKQYTLKQLIDDVQNINYEQFQETVKTLIVPSNCKIYVNGNLSDLTDEQLARLEQLLQKKDPMPTLAGKYADPYMRQDCHLLELSREPYNIDILSFLFEKKVGMMDRTIYMMIETDKLPTQDCTLHIDPFDTSVITNEKELAKRKLYFKRIATKEQFQKAREKALTVFKTLLEDSPQRFNEFVTNMTMNGVSPLECMSVLAELEYEKYAEIAQTIKPIVSEAQIVMRR